MTTKEVLKELEGYGNPGTKNVFLKHGAREPFFGVQRDVISRATCIAGM